PGRDPRPRWICSMGWLTISETGDCPFGRQGRLSDQFHTWRGNRPPGPAHSANGFCEGGRQPSSCVRAGIPFTTRSNDRGNAPSDHVVKPRSTQAALESIAPDADPTGQRPQIGDTKSVPLFESTSSNERLDSIGTGGRSHSATEASAYAQDGRTSVWETSGFEKDFIRTRNP